MTGRGWLDFERLVPARSRGGVKVHQAKLSAWSATRCRRSSAWFYDRRMPLEWTSAEQQVRALERLADAFSLDAFQEIQHATWPNRSMGQWRIEMRRRGATFHPAPAGR